MTIRYVLTWKFAFYQGLLPALRRLGPAPADAIIAKVGRFSSFLWPPRKKRLAAALAAAGEALGDLASDWNANALAPELAAGTLRFMARDYLLASDDDRETLALFDVNGEEELSEALARGRGVVLVGSHFGGHIAAFHWLFRNRIPVRLMVQRPRHVSAALARFFDRDELRPQSDFFLSRNLEPSACVARMLNARAALREGIAVYLPGDIPWQGPNTRSGRLLGKSHQFLSVWADLAAITGAPVFHVVCTHREKGRFELSFEPAGTIAPGEQADAVERYLGRLEAAIAADPADAVAHLLWPCFSPIAGETKSGQNIRPSRRSKPISVG